MYLYKKITSLITSCIIITVILFPNNIYSMQKNEQTPKEVIIGGELLQLEMKTSKVMVYGVEENNKLKNYDLIESVSGDIVEKVFNKNEIKIKHRSDIISLLISMKDYESLNLNILRNNKKIKLKLTKNELNHSYLTEKIPYCATLTYIDPEKNDFGAVGHGLEVENYKNILTDKGEMYLAKLSKIQKSKKEIIGNISGDKVYNSQGSVLKSSEYGVSGIINSNEILKNKEIYKVAEPEDVKNGLAHIVINHHIEGTKKSYEINITKVNKQSKKDINSFEFELNDKDLIEMYGGIVQGMSGCPIIQNGKIIGALSHVKTENTKKGVGVYIKWMMED